MGKLATHEFATGAATPDQPFPPSRNPWNLELQPGGSSSGSGTAVAAGLCAGAMGSDTSGSICNPAGWCAVSGHKPTYGLLSRRGVFPLAPSFDTTGPLAWTAEDCALMMDVLAGHDPLDPASASVPPVGYGAAVHKSIVGLRIGLVKHWYAHADGATDDMVNGIDEAANMLRSLGCTVEEVTMPDINDYQACARVIISSECHALYRADVDKHPEKFGYTTRRRVQLGAFLTAEQYVSAMRFRRKLQVDTNDAMRGFDPDDWRTLGAPDRFENPPIFHFLGVSVATQSVQRHWPTALTVCCWASATTALHCTSSSPAGRSTMLRCWQWAAPTNARRHFATSGPWLRVRFRLPASVDLGSSAVRTTGSSAIRRAAAGRCRACRYWFSVNPDPCSLNPCSLRNFPGPPTRIPCSVTTEIAVMKSA
jgi:aspartyl-tRNA(Asn)/glutamyl-tRNA(Gln) amidotransferase subunit A